MQISLVVSNVNLAVGSQTLKLGVVRNTEPARLVFPTANSFLGVTIRDPALFDSFKPGQRVKVTIEPDTEAGA